MEDISSIMIEISELTKKRNDLRHEIDSYNNEIKNFIELKPTLKENIENCLIRMNTTIDSISKNIEKINSFHDEITRPKDGEEKSRLDFFNETFFIIKENKIKADADRNAIEDFKLELFGDPFKKVVGQKERIENLEKEIVTKKNKWEEQIVTLFKKIEGLLPGATSTGLAKAYQDQRKSYEAPYWLWAIIFVSTIFGIIFFAIKNLHDVTSIQDAFMKIISRLPFFVPAFWLAIFASKQQSQNKRLQQEYAYKEVLTKSYEADKREIEKLPDSEDKLKLSTKLLETMIDAAKYNPSETLSSSIHNDSPPSVFELFKMKLLDKLTR
jgi:cell division protein FtsB